MAEERATVAMAAWHRAWSGSPERQGWLLALFVCACVFGMGGWRVWRAHEVELANSRVIRANLVRSLADHAQGVVREADIVLAGLVERLRTEGESGGALERLHRVMMDRVAMFPALHHLVVFSADGNALTASFEPMPAVNVADRAYFAAHRDGAGDGPLVGPPVQNRADGRWSLTISRRVETAGGLFAGVVVAVIDVETFSRHYATFDLGPNGAISLVHSSNVLVVRHPALDAMARLRPVTQDWAQAPASGAGRQVSPRDGVVRYFSYRRAEQAPLTVVVALAEDDVLAGWRHDSWLTLIACFIVSAALLLLGWRLAAQMRLRHGAELAARREAARAVASEAKIATYVDHLADGVMAVRVSAAGRMAYERVNASACTLLGLTGDVVGQEPRAVLAAGQVEAMSVQFSECLDTGQPISVQHGWEVEGGLGRRVVEVHVSPVRQRAGERIGLLVCSLRDVTAQTNLKAQLLQSQRMEAVGQLTAGVAHDFNNMLQAQMCGLELLLEEVSGQERASRYVEMALSAGEHGARLTHSLLAFSRKQVLRPEPVDLPALLGRLRGLLSRTLDPRISLQMSVADCVGRPSADSAQLEAALLNLCLNARDAMEHRGGRLLIEAVDGTAFQSVPMGLAPADCVVLTVSDEGCGMDADTVARACEPFFTTKGVGRGSGLGLSMVQGFARQSHGELRLTSVMGEGTRIELWLPKAGPVSGEGQAPGLEPVWHSPGRLSGRILLVDDDLAVRDLLGETLESAGFELVVAGTGEEALALIWSDGRIQAVVTDYAMPGMTGGELLQRARRVRPDLSAVVITGHAGMEQVGTMEPGVRVLHKPFRGERLVSCLAGLLAGGSEGREVLESVEA